MQLMGNCSILDAAPLRPEVFRRLESWILEEDMLDPETAAALRLVQTHSTEFEKINWSGNAFRLGQT